jgi:hypothetical protein
MDLSLFRNTTYVLCHRVLSREVGPGISTQELRRFPAGSAKANSVSRWVQEDRSVDSRDSLDSLAIAILQSRDRQGAVLQREQNSRYRVHNGLTHAFIRTKRKPTRRSTPFVSY